MESFNQVLEGSRSDGKAKLINEILHNINE